LVEKIKNEKGLTLKNIAEMADVSYSTLRRVLKGESRTTIATVVSILAVLADSNDEEEFLRKHFPKGL
jgi:predicted transcriptional regulator